VMPRSTRFVNVCISGVHAAKVGFFTASLGALLMACGGAAVPPQELLDARAAFAEAAKGPAADLAPAQLDTAKQSLDGAQRSFDEEGPSQTTKDRAYVAQRRAQIAAAEGGREKADRKRAAADKDLKNTQAQGLENYQKTKEALAAEKAARVEAERKAAVALASLAEIAKVKEETRGVVITLSGSVLFGTGKSDLLPIAKEKLNQVAKALTDQGLQSHRGPGLHGLGGQRFGQRFAVDATRTVGA
jgi:outer membrane protein OmpA-like peptidoglycan-associated protein